MRAEVIANSMVEKLANSLVFANFLHIYNDKLIDLAADYHIELPRSYNLVSLAISAAHDAGAGDHAEEVALDAINHAVFKEKTDDELEYSHEYVKYRVMPNLVFGLKAKGHSIDDIHKNHFVKDIVNKYNVKESYIDKLYKEDKKPAGNPIVKMMEKKHVTGNVFEKYTPSKGKFVTWWFHVIKDFCKDILEKIHNADKLMEHALRISPTDAQEHDDHSSHSHNYVVHDTKQEENFSKAEAKTLKKRLIDFLKKKNPKYEKAINLISDGKDIFSAVDRHTFEKDLELDHHDFEHFKIYFFKDLKQAFQHLDVNNTDEGLAVLKSAKIASKILNRLFNG